MLLEKQQTLEKSDILDEISILEVSKINDRSLVGNQSKTDYSKPEVKYLGVQETGNYANMTETEKKGKFFEFASKIKS